MWDFKRVKALVVGSLLVVTGWGTVIPQGLAADLPNPAQVVSDYLASLANGDTDRLGMLLDGAMKDKNSQVFLYPETYAPFLKEHYANVQMTVEEITPDADEMHARVRFEDGASKPFIVVLILSQVDGQWKITDELYSR